MKIRTRHNPQRQWARTTTGTRGAVLPLNYSQTNPRGCPGSYAKVRSVDGVGVCPFCNQDKKVRKDGTLKAHVRPR